VGAVQGMYDAAREGGNDGGREELTYLELWDVICAAIGGVGVVGEGEDAKGRECTFIVDGYDECLGDELRGLFLKDLVEDLGQMSPHARSLVRVLVVSRDEADIRKHLGCRGEEPKEDGIERWECEITPTHTMPDIISFASSLVERHSRHLADVLTESARHNVVMKIAEKSEGRFLWVRFFEHELSVSTPSTEDDILEPVHDLASGLDYIYSNALNKITQLRAGSCREGPQERDIAVSILRWTLFAFRPLTIEQLSQSPVSNRGLVDIIPGAETLWMPWREGKLSDNELKNSLLRLTGPLITITSTPDTNASLKEQTIQLAHSSLKQYMYAQLDSPPDQQEPWVNTLGFQSTTKEQTALYKICLRFLAITGHDDDFMFNLPPSTNNNNNNTPNEPDKGWVSYGFWAWYAHGIQGDKGTLDGESWDDLSELALSPGREKSNWPEGRHSPVYYASEFGQTDAIRWMEVLPRGLDSSARGCKSGRYGFPLQAAAAGRRVGTVRHLLARHGGRGGGGGKGVEGGGKEGEDEENKGEEGEGEGKYGSALAAAVAQLPRPLPASVEIVRVLLSDPETDVNAADKGGMTALHYAAMANGVSAQGCAEAAKLLLERGADVNRLTGKFQSAAFMAAGLGHVDVMRALIDHGADLESAGKPGPVSPWEFPSPMQHAVSCAGPDMVGLLLDSLNGGEGYRRGDPLVFPDGMGAIHCCVSKRPPGVDNLKVLLDRGVDPNLGDKTKWTPLQVAASWGDLDVIRVLVEAGAHLSGNPGNGSYTYSAMQMAVVRDQPGSIKLLVELGADVNQDTGHGITPIITAAKENKQELASLLLDLGADMTSVLQNNHWSVFDTAKKEGHSGVAELLVRRGCFGSALGAGGSGDDGYEEFVVNAYKGDKSGVDRISRKDGARLFLPSGAAEEGLRAAAAEGHFSVVEHLLRKGAEINAQDVIGRTALHHAIMHLKEEIMEFLAERGADIEVKDKRGLTPIALARFKGDLAAKFVGKYGKE